MKTIVQLIIVLALSVSGSVYSQTALTPGPSVAFNPGETIANSQVKLFTLVPAQAETINASAGSFTVGTKVSLEITTSGTTSYTLTFATGLTGAGSLETGTTSGIVYVLDFIYDGASFVEISRKRQGNAVVTVPYVATTSVLPYAEGVGLYVYTPTASVTLNPSVVGRAGAVIDVEFVSDGTGETVTLGTLFKTTNSAKTITTAATTNSFARFVSDGTNWREASRETGLTP